ncbi:hypothetical protein KA005_22770, partial [bacterium]|nr:hypothetical protein [bacterium]
TFRKYIGDKVISLDYGDEDDPKTIVVENDVKINIYFNGDPLKSYDPLYRIPFKPGDTPCEDEHLDYMPLIIPYPIMDIAWQEKLQSKVAPIIVHFGIAPREWRNKIRISAKDRTNRIERRIQGGATRELGDKEFWDSRMVSIMRSGREVGWVHDRWLTGRFDDLDRWWGMEIEFGPELDDAFNVRNVKYEVKPEGDLRRKIRDEIGSAIETVRKEISTYFADQEIEDERKEREKQLGIPEGDGTTDKGEGGISTIPKSPTQVAVEEDPEIVGEVKDTTESPQEMVARLFGHLPDVSRQTILDEWAKRKLKVVPNYDKRVPEDTNMMFEYSAQGSRVLMVRYENHPYHKQLYERYELLKELGIEIEELLSVDGSDVETQDMITLLRKIDRKINEIEALRNFGMESAVIALARLQPTPSQEKILNHFLSEWSRLNMALVNERFANEEDVD